MRFVKALLAASVLAVVAVPNAVAFRWDDAARLTPTGVTGQPYFHALGTLAGCKGVYMTVVSGALPPGLNLVGNKREDVDGSDWRIEGVPTAPGEYGFWLRAQNLCEGDSTEEPFMIRVVSGLAIQQSAMPMGTVGTAYAPITLTAAGGGNLTWSIASGTLPTGLTLASNGVVSGTPSAEANGHTVKVAVTDGGGRRAEQTLTFTIRAQLAVGGTTVPTAQIDQPFEYAGLRATGGSGVNTWSIFSGELPEGVTINPSTGALTGTPTEAGIFLPIVRVVDNEGRWKDTRVVIRVASPIEIVTQRLAALRAGRLYSLSIETEGGVAIPRYGRDTFNWRIIRGRLPIGLRLNTRVGKLIGRPRQAGTFRITLQVTDKFRSVDTQTLVIKVNKKS